MSGFVIDPDGTVWPADPVTGPAAEELVTARRWRVLWQARLAELHAACELLVLAQGEFARALRAVAAAVGTAHVAWSAEAASVELLGDGSAGEELAGDDPGGDDLAGGVEAGDAAWPFGPEVHAVLDVSEWPGQ